MTFEERIAARDLLDRRVREFLKTLSVDGFIDSPGSSEGERLRREIMLAIGSCNVPPEAPARPEAKQ